MKKIQILLSIAALTALYLQFSSAASAIGNACAIPDDNPLPRNDAFVDGLSGSFTVWAKLNGTAPITVAALSHDSSNYDQCRDVGTVTLNTDKYVQVGSMTSTGNGDVITMKYEATEPYQGASMPSIILINAQSACQQPECVVNTNDEKYELLPKKVSTSFDTLSVNILGAFDEQMAVANVAYFQGNTQLYSSAELKPFDTKYFSGGKHTLTTIVEYADGTVIRTSDTIEKPQDAVSFFLPKVLKYQTTLLWLAVIIGIYALYLLCIAGLRKLLSYRKWKKTHVAKVSSNAISRDPSARYEMYQKADARKKELKIVSWTTLAPLGLLGLFFVANTWVVAIFTVDGISMETTLHNNDKHLYLKYPVVFGNLNGRTYIPKRGEVVVFKKTSTSVVNNQPSAGEESYIVKRVLGLPGERVVLSGTKVIVYNAENPQGFDVDQGSPWQNVLAPVTIKKGEVTLKEDEIFVVGDDREYSVDSRDYGPINANQVVGKVVYKNDPSKQPYIFNETDLQN